MRINKDGIDFILSFEGCKLTAYQDICGIWTIGAGHIGSVYGNKIHAGMQITKTDALNLLKEDLIEIESAINNLVKVTLSQNQYNSLCSFIYNVGIYSFKKSMLLAKINENKMYDAANEFLAWGRAGSHSSALYKRRVKEKELFLS
ncbi:lysozyme [Yersinia enterocolitica]|uniref:lysozyme n=1 Tax=Yersinia enterocolitica TaxID=630 RepID=UPI003D093EA0